MQNIKEIYESPEMEIVLFDAEDVITTSGPDSGSNETQWKPWG